MLVVKTGLTKKEEAMFQEVALIMEKHKTERKFNLALEHSHFYLEDNEVMHETNDKTKRILITHPVQLNDLSENAIPTQWDVKNGTIKITSWCCD